VDTLTVTAADANGCDNEASSAVPPPDAGAIHEIGIV